MQLVSGCRVQRAAHGLLEWTAGASLRRPPPIAGPRTWPAVSAAPRTLSNGFSRAPLLPAVRTLRNACPASPAAIAPAARSGRKTAALRQQRRAGSDPRGQVHTAHGLLLACRARPRAGSASATFPPGKHGHLPRNDWTACDCTPHNRHATCAASMSQARKALSLRPLAWQRAANKPPAPRSITAGLVAAGLALLLSPTMRVRFPGAVAAPMPAPPFGTIRWSLPP